MSPHSATVKPITLLTFSLVTTSTILLLLSLSFDIAKGNHPKHPTGTIETVIYWKKDNVCEFRFTRPDNDHHHYLVVPGISVYNRQALLFSMDIHGWLLLYNMRPQDARKCAFGVDADRWPTTYPIEHVHIKMPILEKCSDFEPVDNVPEASPGDGFTCRIVRVSEKDSSKFKHHSPERNENSLTSSSSASSAIPQQQQQFSLYECNEKICDMNQDDKQANFFMDPVDWTVHILPKCHYTKAWKRCAFPNLLPQQVDFIEIGDDELPKNGTKEVGLISKQQGCHFHKTFGPGDRFNDFKMPRFSIYNNLAMFVPSVYEEEVWFLREEDAMKCTVGLSENGKMHKYPIEHKIIEKPIREKCEDYEPIIEENATTSSQHQKLCRIARKIPSQHEHGAIDALAKAASPSTANGSRSAAFPLFACVHEICDKRKEVGFFLNSEDGNLHILPDCSHIKKWGKCVPYPTNKEGVIFFETNEDSEVEIVHKMKDEEGTQESR